MATTKKTSVKKKPTTRKSTTTKTKTSKAKRAPFVQSFRPTSSDTPFLTFRITKQTLYWFILSIVVLFFGLWIVKLQIQIEDIYNSIEFNNMALNTVPPQSVHQAK